MTSPIQKGHVARSSEHTIGLVTPCDFHYDAPFELACGQSLSEFSLRYETYGQLNLNKSNAVLICHALSGHHHAAGYYAEDTKPGWWNSYIGPGKPIDTNLFYVVSVNNLGSCFGSSGPTSPMPGSDKLYGPDFPIVTVGDWVKSQKLLAEHLQIAQWAAVVGGSLGGMQALQWSVDFPKCCRSVVCIASAPKLSAQNIAFNEVARQAITKDPDFKEGRYLESGDLPRRGLAVARMLGHITYLSEEGMRNKFGRGMKSDEAQFHYEAEFEVESYLRHQGNAFSEKFDANSYLLMTKALDYFDISARSQGDLAEAFKSAVCDFYVVSFSSDWRFPPVRSKEIVEALVQAKRQVNYIELASAFGHDAFLIHDENYIQAFSAMMRRVFDKAVS